MTGSKLILELNFKRINNVPALEQFPKTEPKTGLRSPPHQKAEEDAGSREIWSMLINDY